MKNEKILRRIKNLLDMAGDSANANEAMIAAKRARSLMDKYQVEKEDLLDDANGNNFGESEGEYQTKVRNVWICHLSMHIATLNDCQFIIRRGRNKGILNVSFVFRGFKSDAIIAKYMHDYLIKSCNRLLKVNKIKGRSSMNFFRLGFAEGVGAQIQEITKERKNKLKTGNEKSLVIKKMQMVDAHFDEPIPTFKTKSKRADISERLALDKGRVAGKNISLDKQIETKNRTSLIKKKDSKNETYAIFTI